MVVPEFHRLTNEYATIDAVLHRRSHARSDAVVLFTHPRSMSNLTSYPGPALAARGIDALCFNNRFTNSPAGSDLGTVFEEFALDIAAAVSAARQMGYRSVLLSGHSAGGPAMAFYQNLAENGPAAARRSTLSGFAGFRANGHELHLPPADGLVLRSVTIGTAASFLIRLDASVIDESSAARDPDLDMYHPRHLIDPETSGARFDPAFLAAYYRRQAQRMNALIERAQETLRSIERGAGRFSDDDFVVIPGTRANPTTIDLGLASRTQGSYPIYPPGTPEPISDVRPINLESAQNRAIGGAAVHRIRAMLTYRLVRVDPERFDPLATTAAASGIDFASSHSSTPTNLAGVSVPLLLIQGSGDESNSVKLPTAELNYDAAASADKSLVLVRGANHGMLPVQPSYGDTRSTAADVIAEWILARFGSGG